MNGFLFKKAAICTLLSIGFLSSATFAANVEKNSKNKNIYSAKMGCMSCHQAEVASDDTSVQSDTDQAE